MDENNNENRYQVIDPVDDNYRIRSKDLVKSGHRKHPKFSGKRKKKMSGGLKALITILVIIGILAGSGVAVVFFYLGKINYGDTPGTVDPNLESQETLSFSKQSDADNAIKNNLDDNTLWFDSRVYNILLVGVDYGNVEGTTADGRHLSRSDSMILLSINSVDNVINMVSLSRAAYVAIPGHGNKRLNAAHAYAGPQLLVDTIEKNYKIRIDRYITVDFSGFTDIIDILGGVSIEMTAQEAKSVLNKSKAGTYKLNGNEAIAYSRLRYIDSDRQRTGRQRNVLNAIANQFRHASVSSMLTIMNEILPLVTTNFSKTELITQATNVPQYLSMPINEDIIPHNATSLTMRDGQEVLILNWADTKSYVHKLLYANIIPESAN